MDTETSISDQYSRPQRASLSALLVVSLLIGVTISAIKPGVRALHRDASADLLATRHIAQSLVRVVRGLASRDDQRPAVRLVSNQSPPPRPIRQRAGAEVQLRDPSMLRESLLALPPPVV